MTGGMTGGTTGGPLDPGSEERLARATLSLVTEPGDPRVTALVAQHGPARALEILRGRTAEDPGVTEAQLDLAERLRTAQPERDLARAADQGIRFVVPGDEEWPRGVDELADCEALQQRGGPPIGLWARGPVRLDDLGRSVAVVGSRSATSYGADVARDLAAVLGRAGWAVVSGAAFGIDQAAHRGALAEEAATVAVLACGVDRAYPEAHRTLLEHLATHGAVVSEAAPGWSPTRVRFLARNRLIAALSAGTVVVEAAVRSGALNTANWAGRLNRPVMGVPGPVSSAPSKGVHQLIRTGAATLVTSGADVLELVGQAGQFLLEEPREAPRPRDALSMRLQQILDAVPVSRPAHTDSIARAAGVAVAEVQEALEGMHRHGLVESGPDGWRLAALAHT